MLDVGRKAVVEAAKSRAWVSRGGGPIFERSCTMPAGSRHTYALIAHGELRVSEEGERCTDLELGCVRLPGYESYVWLKNQVTRHAPQSPSVRLAQQPASTRAARM